MGLCGLLTCRLVSDLIVTIDGPGGTGKSTVSRVVAARAGLPHLDTGAFYRAATLAVLEAAVDPDDSEAVGSVVADLVMSQEQGRMFIGARDVSDEIRGEAVTSAVSAVSAHPRVRSQLVEMQRGWIDEHDGRGVVEGRDIGSVVFPNADLKVYLDATAEVRARRRAMETGEVYEDVLEDLNRRDHLDSTRPASPLLVPEGAIVIDTSSLSFDRVVETILGLIQSKS
jgi:CMP/dCMP kinase